MYVCMHVYIYIYIYIYLYMYVYVIYVYVCVSLYSAPGARGEYNNCNTIDYVIHT